MSEHHLKGMTENPRPTNLVLHQKSRILEIIFDDGSQFNLPCEYLRVYSPSAAVKGHGPDRKSYNTASKTLALTASNRRERMR